MSKKIISLLLTFIFFVITPLQVANVQAQTVITTSSTSGFTFTKDLAKGVTDYDVQKLQVVLNSDIQTQVAASGAGSSGSESTYFGDLTHLAVIKFQEKYASEILAPNGLSQGTGFVGQSTRVKLNQIIVQKSISFSGLSVNTVTTTGSQPNTSTCQFIELLINIQVIAFNKAVQARSALGCPAGSVSNTETQSNISSESSADDLFISSDASVDLKVNGSNGPVNITPGQTITLSWTSTGIDKCFFGSNSGPKSGTKTFSPIISGIYTINCADKDGNKVYDAVTVNVVSTSATSSQPFVDLKVNGQDSNLSVSPGDTILVSWTSQNVTSCVTGSTTRPISGFFNYTIPAAFSTLTNLDVSITCTGQVGTVYDVVLMNIVISSNSVGANLIAPSSLADQVASSTTNTTVYFSGTMKTAGKCDGEDDFYRVFISPKDGQPVVTSVDNLPPDNYGVGKPSTVLKLLYWDHGDIPTPVNGSTVVGEADGVKSYHCTYSGSAPSGDVIDGGVIFGVGQLTESTTANTTSDTQLTLASGAGLNGESGTVPQQEASNAASKIKDKDGGFLGTGYSLATVVAVVAVAACATGVGCLLTASYYAYYSAAAVAVYYAEIAAVGYIIGSVGDTVINNSGSSGGGL